MPSLPFTTPGPFVPLGPVTLPNIAKGASNSTSESLLRKYINKAFKGKNWDALIAGLATADTFARQLIIDAFDQFFLSRASDKYLNARASDVGINRPSYLFGMDDEAFRRLSISITSSKITYQAIENVLEAFYGLDSTHITITNNLPELYNLVGGETLIVKIDNDTITVLFEANDFRIPGQATAFEVASIINRFLNKTRSYATVIPVINPADDLYYIKIINNTFGLRGRLEVTGGSAQAALSFPTGSQSLYSNYNATFLSRSQDGLDVIMPVTSPIVTRDENSAAYLNGSGSLNITDASRELSGVCTATTSSNPALNGISQGGWVFIDELAPTAVTSATTCITVPNTVNDFSNPSVILMANGQVLIANELNTTNVYSLDPIFDTYTQLASSFAIHQEGLGAFVKLDDNRYILFGGPGTDVVETYHLDTNVWTLNAPMPSIEDRPQAFMLSTGKIFVWGNGTQTANIYDPVLDSWSACAMPLGGPYNASPLLVALPDDRIFINQDTSTEIYHASLDLWIPVLDPSFSAFATGGCFAPVGPSGSVFRFGGNNGADLNVITRFDIATSKWLMMPTGLQVPRIVPAVHLLPDNVIMVISGNSQTIELYDINSGDISYGPPVPGIVPHSWANIVPLSDWRIVVFGLKSSPTYYTDQRNQIVTTGGFNGLFKVDSVLPNGFLYTNPEYPIAAHANSGKVTALAQATGIMGPYLISPTEGWAIVDANTTTTALFSNTNILQVASTAGFPTEGFLVFNFGTKDEIGPAKYVLKLSGAELLMDNTFTETLPIGTVVRVLSQSTPYDPSSTTYGFWLTASTAARDLCSQMLNDVKASGITFNQIVHYPSDRGLGNEGGITPKVSDKIVVWGNNEVDQEVAAIRAAYDN